MRCTDRVRQSAPVRSLARRRGVAAGFSLVEMLVVIGVIVVLLALLLPALNIARKNSLWAGSQSNLRQIFTLMSAYTTDNRDHIVPSQFDYSASPTPGKVRTQSPPGIGPLLGSPSEGTWTDILWTTAGLGPVLVPTLEYDYRFDSPDRPFFEQLPDFDSIFRSRVANGHNAQDHGNSEALPFGHGAMELGSPGYFAANDFFNSTLPNRWFTLGQIRRPQNSIYIVDSFYGEIIGTAAGPWDGRLQSDPNATGQVDFRYVGDTALLMMLDGRIVTQPRWEDLDELVEDFQFRVNNLDQ